jgi:hypothetical protein
VQVTRLCDAVLEASPSSVLGGVGVA